MVNKLLVQIVPYLPPASTGVGDYAELLGRELLAAYSIRSHYVVANGGPQSAQVHEVTLLGSHSRSELETVLGDLAPSGVPVLVHYVGYGYQRRGVPIWLLKGLDAWQKGDVNRRFSAFFHELYASGPPWTSAFWLSPLQQWVCVRLARRASCCLTNRSISACWLATKAKCEPSSISVLPVFSNLGEPTFRVPLAERKPQMAVYGGVSRLRKDQGLAKKCLLEACARLGIEKVVGFGRSSPCWSKLGLASEQRGILAPEEASHLLLESQAAFLDYFDGYLGKSGIFAAYCAHGTLPILLRPNASEPDGMRRNTHYLAACDLPSRLELPDQQAIADSARQWYMGHSITKIASSFAKRLFSIRC